MNSVLDRLVHDLRSVETELRDRPVLAQRVRAIAALLAGEEVQWIGTTKARRLLGVRSENSVKAWARLGVLRSRREPNGRLKVSLEDVLARRAINTDLEGDGDNRELSPEEHRILAEPLSSEESDGLKAGLARLGVAPLPADGDAPASAG